MNIYIYVYIYIYIYIYIYTYLHEHSLASTLYPVADNSMASRPNPAPTHRGNSQGVRVRGYR
jgi:hypothetical protein